MDQICRVSKKLAATFFPTSFLPMSRLVLCIKLSSSIPRTTITRRGDTTVFMIFKLIPLSLVNPEPEARNFIREIQRKLLAPIAAKQLHWQTVVLSIYISIHTPATAIPEGHFCFSILSHFIHSLLTFCYIRNMAWKRTRRDWFNDNYTYIYKDIHIGLEILYTRIALRRSILIL